MTMKSARAIRGDYLPDGGGVVTANNAQASVPSSLLRLLPLLLIIKLALLPPSSFPLSLLSKSITIVVIVVSPRAVTIIINFVACHTIAIIVDFVPCHAVAIVIVAITCRTITIIINVVI